MIQLQTTDVGEVAGAGIDREAVQSAFSTWKDLAIDAFDRAKADATENGVTYAEVDYTEDVV